jgi:hypothetical protein
VTQPASTEERLERLIAAVERLVAAMEKREPEPPEIVFQNGPVTPRARLRDGGQGR